MFCFTLQEQKLLQGMVGASTIVKTKVQFSKICLEMTTLVSVYILCEKIIGYISIYRTILVEEYQYSHYFYVGLLYVCPYIHSSTFVMFVT